MMLRAIHIFPRFDNEHEIDGLRARYDPLARLIGPHITLVFPFESEMESTFLQRHVEKSVQSFQPFQVVLRGITGDHGGYLFLNVKQGNDEIVALHDALYSGPLRGFLYRRLTYVPHLTVGRITDAPRFEHALDETEGFCHEFQTVVSAVSIESISETGVSTVEFVIPFSLNEGL